MRSTVQIALGLAVLLVGAIAAWLILSAGARYLFGLDKAIVSAIIAAFVAVFSIIFSFWKERARARAEAHREKKIEVYSMFFDIVFDTLKASKDDKLSDEYFSSDKFKDEFFSLMRGVTFYGSPSVILALNQWKVSGATVTEPFEAMRQIGSVLLAMRKDIGLSNFGIDNLSIHQIYVTDDLKKLTAAKAGA